MAGGPIVRTMNIPSDSEKDALAAANNPSAANPFATITDLGGAGGSGYSGVSGTSGQSGASGYSGESGVAGQPGESGASGESGYSGAEGPQGISGYSGYSGYSGLDGAAASSGYSGYSGESGASGVSGADGASGVSGYSGQDGVLGGDGASGVSGFSGVSGYSGQDGIIGADGASGTSGYSGEQGLSGFSGASGQIPALAANDLTDVNTNGGPGPGPQRNYVMAFNGSEWVPAPTNYNFALQITGFADDQTDTQLIGAGQPWRVTGTINFTATYMNGPPSSAYIALTSDGGVTWGSNLTLTTPFASASSVENTAYPSTKDRYVRFTLNANAGSDNPTATQTVTFRNNIKYGVTIEASGWDSTDINNLAGTLLSNAHTGNFAGVVSGSGEYILFAHPSSYTQLHATGFLFNGVACAFEASTTFTVTNSAGFSETYRVYRSTQMNLGSSTLVTSTSDNRINPIYWGVSTSATGPDVQALTGGSNQISNNKLRSFTVFADAGEYIVYAFPSRLGLVSLWILGLDQTGGFNRENYTVTNVNLYGEDYYVYISKNAGLLSTTVSVQAPT